MRTHAHGKKLGWRVAPLQLLPLLLGLVFASAASMANAQSSMPAAAPMSRAEVKMERDEFLKTHRWDMYSDNWVMMEESEAPAGVKTRAQVKAERDEFLSKHNWDEASSKWVPVTGEPRVLSKRTRAQVKADTRAFVRTHRWDGGTQSWVDAPASKK